MTNGLKETKSRLHGNCPGMGLPFLVGGGLKIVYDLLLYRSFSKADMR